MLYGAEIWGNACNSQPLEAVDNKFLKAALGLPQSAANAGVVLETDHLSLYWRARARPVAYWLKLLRLGDGRLVRTALRVQRQLCEDGKKCWGTKVRDTLELAGLQEMWNVHVIEDTDAVLKRVVVALSDQARAETLGECMDKPSLREYLRSSKQQHDWYEQGIGSMARESRRLLVAARLNVPVLAQRTNRGNRTFWACTVCKEEVEDVWLHLLYKCSKVTASDREKIELHETDVGENSRLPIFQQRKGIVNFLKKCRALAVGHE